ncbi:hypothetical protein LMU33_03330 [Streptomyces sp. JA03]|nr:hypothetical protein [Streptomyces barringtoniae]
MANESDDGLLAGVYSRDSATAFRVATAGGLDSVRRQLLPRHPRHPFRRHRAQRLRARARRRNASGIHLPEDQSRSPARCG